eukprot:1155384_1
MINLSRRLIKYFYRCIKHSTIMKSTTAILSIITIHLLSHCHCALTGIGPDTIPTPLHGGIGGNPGSSWTTYPVNAILTWVECNYGYWREAVSRLTFSNSDGFVSPNIGGDDGVSCGAVTLDPDEYINAYKIWTATPHGKCVTYTIYVFGFAFRTNKGRELQCGGADNGCSEHETTGWVTYEKYFMGGVNWRGGSILDAIGFCFIRDDLVGAAGLSCDPPPTCEEQGLSFKEPHSCQCQSECGGRSSLEEVATRLEQRLMDYRVCPNLAETCCCSAVTSDPTGPTLIPSTSPTSESISPTLQSVSPTSESVAPTSFTSQPTPFPVRIRSTTPTTSPTKSPSIFPSNQPAEAPTNGPTKQTTSTTATTAFTVYDATTQAPLSTQIATNTDEDDIDVNSGDDDDDDEGKTESMMLAGVDNTVVFVAGGILI